MLLNVFKYKGRHWDKVFGAEEVVHQKNAQMILRELLTLNKSSPLRRAAMIKLVIILSGEGFGNKVIADELKVSISTVNKILRDPELSETI